MTTYKQFNILNILFFLSFLAVFLGLNTPKVMAKKHHHHKAHVHGIAHINIALEGNELYIEFTSPAANIVGFEHHPKTEKEKNAVNGAIKTLKAGENLFTMPPRAGTRLTESSVESGIEFDSEHESEDTHKHESGEHREEKHHKEHHKEDEHEQHSEFKAVYRFTCKNPDELTHIDVMLFRMYKGIEHIEVQVLTSTKQTAFELTEEKNRISF